MPAVLSALVAFVAEHRRCGELDGGLEGDMVWLACRCGAEIVRPASPPPAGAGTGGVARPSSTSIEVTGSEPAILPAGKPGVLHDPWALS